MMIQKIMSLAVIMLLAIGLFTSPMALAEKQHIEAVGTYVLGDRDTRDVAERRAIKDGIRVAAQKAGYYVETYAKTVNYELTADETTMIAASILRVYDTSTTFIKNGTVCQATVYAVAETADIESLLNSIHGTTPGGTKQRKEPKSLSQMGEEYGITAAEPVEEVADVSTYTGIVIDCLDARGKDDLCVNRTGAESTIIKTKSGRILLDYYTPTKKNNFTYVFGLQYYDPTSVEQIAGSNPFWVHASYVETPKNKNPWGRTVWSGTIVISEEDADVIEDIQDRTGMLSSSRPPVVVLGSYWE